MSSIEHAHKRFPERLAFLLNNPIRKALHPPNELLSKLAITKSDIVLDFGCGAGFFTIPIAKMAAKTIALDASSQMLEKTAHHAEKNHVAVELLKSDGTAINLEDNSVDLVLLFHVFHEVEDKPRVLREICRILKPSGRLAIVEKTRGDGIFSGKFGPPVLRQDEVIGEIARSGFKPAETLPHDKDSIIIGHKPIT